MKESNPLINSTETDHNDQQIDISMYLRVKNRFRDAFGEVFSEEASGGVLGF